MTPRTPFYVSIRLKIQNHNSIATGLIRIAEWPGCYPSEFVIFAKRISGRRETGACLGVVQFRPVDRPRYDTVTAGRSLEIPHSCVLIGSTDPHRPALWRRKAGRALLS